MQPGRGFECQPIGTAFLAWQPPPEPPGPHYDFSVFISHAGEQKRGFVDFLRQSFEMQFPLLNVFVDQHSIHSRGEEQWPPLRTNALHSAAVVIVVLSREYILGRHPMELLHALLDRNRMLGSKASTLLPVFYDITAEEVVALIRACQAPQGVDMEQWLSDLHMLLELNRLPHAQDCEATGPRLVSQVVARVAELLAEGSQLPVSRPEELPEVTVGLEKVVAAMVKELTAVDSTRMLLLTGMGGIGKTTMAKVLFNELHAMDRTMPCCFLRLDPEGREAGIVEKQQELLRGLTCAPTAGFSTVAEGRQLLGQKLWGKKVLVVVDNVWDGQLEELLPKNIMEVLGPGSLVLVTSRVSGAAASLTAQQSVMEMPVELLSRKDSRMLLCRHAGYSSSMAAGNAALIQMLLDRCGGLPMALEVVGRRLAHVDDPQGFLLHPEEAVAYAYKSVLAGRLEKHRTLFQELQLSWDTLEAGEKEALLDVALVLKGQPWERAGAYFAEGMLERLCKLAFVSRGEGPAGGRRQQAVNGKVNVHPVILDFCKMAVRGCEDQRLDLKVEDTGGYPIWEELATLEDVQVLKLQGYELDAEACSALSALKNLRIMLLEGSIAPALAPVVLSGLSNLRQLCLQGPATPPPPGTPSHSLKLQAMGRLAVLVLERLHQMDRLEGLQGSPSLRTVSIGGCARVQQLQLGGLPALEGLQIEDCEALSRLHLKGCSRLRTLPEGLGQLGALQALDLEGCSGLAWLPEGLGQLSWLQTLDLEGCSGLRHLPESLGQLSALQDLHLKGCSGLTQLPASVVQLGALETLDLTGCSGLTQLPEGLSQLPSLQILELEGCSGLAQLPEPVAMLPSAMLELALSFAVPSATEPVKLSVQAILVGREHLPTIPSRVPACLNVFEGGEGRSRLVHVEEEVLLECRRGRRQPQRLKYSIHCPPACATVLSDPSTRWKLAKDDFFDKLLVTAVLGAAPPSSVPRPSARPPNKRVRVAGSPNPREQPPRFDRGYLQQAPLVEPGTSNTPRMRL